MTATAPPKRYGADRYDAFVRDIINTCRAPGPRAALRRGLRRPPEQAYTMHAIVAWRLPENVRPAVEFAHYAVAAMIAAQASDTERKADEPSEGEGESTVDARSPARPNLGVSLAWAVSRPGTGRRPIGRDAAEKRLHLLVRQSLPGVHRHLPGVVRHLRLLDVPVDWSQLIDDLCSWTTARDQVAKRWLQDFYRTLHQTLPEE